MAAERLTQRATFLVALVFVIGCKPDASVPDEVLASPEVRAAGARLFAENCAICHGPNGHGDGVRRAGFGASPPDFSTRAWRERVSPSYIADAIRYGKKPTSMPAWPGLAEEEVDALVAYIRSLSENPG